MIDSLINRFTQRVENYSKKDIIEEIDPIIKPIGLSRVLSGISDELKFKSAKDFDKVAMAVSISSHMKYRYNNRLIYHSYKVGIIASRLTKILKSKKPEKYCNLEKDEVITAGFLHDIGHLISPINLYFKEEKLNNDEKEILAQHMQQGEIILSILGIKTPSIINATMFHHEKLNGSGHYKLEGRGIPLVARLISIVDIYDALRSERVYKIGFTPNETFKIMYNENQNKVYDSEILDTLRDMSPNLDFFYNPKFFEKLWLFKE